MVFILFWIQALFNKSKASLCGLVEEMFWDIIADKHFIPTIGQKPIMELESMWKKRREGAGQNRKEGFRSGDQDVEEKQVHSGI